MPKPLKLSLLGISVVLIVFVFLGGMLPGGVRAGSDASAYQQMEVYSEVLQHIQNDYVVTPDIPAVTTGALHGLLEGLDPDSGYLTAAEYKQYQAEQGKGTAQIGVNISKRYGYATIVSVVPGSPAEKAGLIDGDAIDTIGPEGTRVMPLQMIQLALSGQPGSKVTFSVIEPTSSSPQPMTLTRKPIQYPALLAQEKENGAVLYLKPYTLDPQRVDEVLARITQTEKQHPEKMLLDLRDTVQGNMEAAVKLSNAFLRSGTIATLEGQKFSKQTWTAEQKNFLTSATLVVLVNHSTSGPAEIVAAALKDNNRAQLVGDRTFGSGAVQKQIPLPDGAELFLSVAKYRTPNGTVIQENAVIPNVTVAEDNELNAAAPAAAPNPVTKPGAPATAAPPPPQHPDVQMDKALSLLQQEKAA